MENSASSKFIFISIFFLARLHLYKDDTITSMSLRTLNGLLETISNLYGRRVGKTTQIGQCHTAVRKLLLYIKFIRISRLLLQLNHNSWGADTLP